MHSSFIEKSFEMFLFSSCRSSKYGDYKKSIEYHNEYKKSEYKEVVYMKE